MGLFSTIGNVLSSPYRLVKGALTIAKNSLEILLKAPLALPLGVLTGRDVLGIKKDFKELAGGASTTFFAGAQIGSVLAAPMTGGWSLAGTYALSQIDQKVNA